MTSMTLREKIERLKKPTMIPDFPDYKQDYQGNRRYNEAIDHVLSLLDEEKAERRIHNALFQDKYPNLLGKPPFHLRIEENIRQDLEMDAEYPYF